VFYARQELIAVRRCEPPVIQRVSTTSTQGTVLRRDPFSVTGPELAVKVDDPHDTSIAAFQHTCLIVVGPSFCTRGP
jgi:hypothetical protein